MRLARITTPSGPRHAIARGDDSAVIERPFAPDIGQVNIEGELAVVMAREA